MVWETRTFLKESLDYIEAAYQGIVITTGSFTLEAKREARRDGVPPIELVDGEKLVEMFQSLELGVVRRNVYEIDETFFEEFKGSRLTPER